MPYIRVTNDTHRAIIAAGDLMGVPVTHPAVPKANGDYEIWFEWDTIERLRTHKAPEESLDAVIFRLCTMHGRKPS
jgi:hypothetical protein